MHLMRLIIENFSFTYSQLLI